MTTYQETSLADLVRDESRRRAAGVAFGRLVDLPVVGRWIAWLTRLANQIPGVTTRITRLHAWLLRRSRGRLKRSWLFAAGQPVISLTTIGRRSGQPRSTAVACFVEGDQLVLAGMNLGRSSHPAWALNLTANPAAVIEIEGQTVEVSARRTQGPERERLWQRWRELQPSADAYQELAERKIPLFVLSRRGSAG